MDRIMLIICQFFIVTWMYGQAPPKELQFSYEIEDKIANGTMRTSTASYYYTFIGNYPQALATYDIPISWGVDTLILDTFGTKPALPLIIQEAKDKQIIIISESHLKPQHRIFAKQIIDSLAKYGFCHLGIETLGPKLDQVNQLLDSNLNERGYAIFGLNDFYARESQMAELIRSAIANKYQIFAYERERSDPSKDRDEIQADNVINYSSTIGSEKIILLCGWHHAIESDLVKRKSSYFMAKYIKDKLGIDPLTIYQDNFTEKVVHNAHRSLRLIDADEPLVFINDQNQIARLTENVDIEVIHPKTKYINGRPNWLLQDPTYVEYDVDREWLDIDFPIFLIAYNLGEESDGTPVDIIEMKEKYEPRTLILKPGKYLLRIDNKKEKKEMEIILK